MQNRIIQYLTPIVLIGFLVSGCSPRSASPPSTERKPVTDEYHGVTVVDNYLWLDDLNDPAVRKWNDAQNAYSRSYFDQIPFLATIQERLTELNSVKSVRYSSLTYQTKLFARKFQPPKNQSFLVTLDSPDELTSEKVVVDPNQLDPKGMTSIDWFVPSRDGRLVAVSLSKGGSEDGSVHVFEVESGNKLPDIVPRVQYPTGGGSLAWNRDGTGFYYTRYPTEEERGKENIRFYQQVYYHKLGTPVNEDIYVIGEEFPRIAEIDLASSDDGRYILATVANGDGGEYAHYLMAPTGKWSQLTKFSDEITRAHFGPANMLYLLSYKNALKGKLLRMRLPAADLSKAQTIVPEGNGAITGFAVGRNSLYVATVHGGPERLHVFSTTGKNRTEIPVGDMASVGPLVVLGNDHVLFESQTYLDPSAWYEYNPSTGRKTTTALVTTTNVTFDDVEVVREFALSKDGTSIPLNILRRKGTELNSQNPTILYGYGGYSISMTPNFRVNRRLWLDQGGVYVVANLRGGGEFGQGWHKEGNLTRKQNVFDDFAAAAQYLIDANYTNSSRLAIMGASNGGLLMGAAFTQHPELFKAVVSYVGIYDMLRVERFPNGEFNTTEFGTVKDPDQFKALYEYSPYHRVVDGTKYPAVLFVTGDNDGRVDPANSRKMTARLQIASTSGLPILLRTDSNAGHGIGTSLSGAIAQEADVHAFLFDQLGMTWKSGKAGAQ